MENPSVSQENIEKAYNAATEARINLTTYKHADINGRHVMKVCAVCDRFIGPDSEMFIAIDNFKTDYFSYFHESKIVDVYDIGSDLMKILSKYYTQKHFRGARFRWLNSMILSPRAYGTNPMDTNAKAKLGCCKQCKNALKNFKSSNKQNGHPCKFAIANGLMIGTAPQCIEVLNDVELALLSKARCEKHIFSFSAGTHSQIKGFHTIYQNDVQHSNAILNYMAQRSDDTSSASSDGGVDEESKGDEESQITIEESSSTDVEDDSQIDMNETKNNICVIMAGPFTERQQALTRKRTKINHRSMKVAMKWLSQNNLIYSNEDCDERIVEPHYVCCHRLVDSSESNIEVVFDINAVFPNSSDVTCNNGGFQTIDDFKKHILGTTCQSYGF